MNDETLYVKLMHILNCTKDADTKDEVTEILVAKFGENFRNRKFA